MTALILLIYEKKKQAYLASGVNYKYPLLLELNISAPESVAEWPK